MAELEMMVKNLGGGVFKAAAIGSINTDTYLIFTNKLEPAIKLNVKVLAIDMGKVEYVSSMGIGAIMEAKKKVEQAGGSFVLVNLQPQIRKIFDIIKAIPREDLFESVEELDNYLLDIQRQEKEKKRPF